MVMKVDKGKGKTGYREQFVESCTFDCNSTRWREIEELIGRSLSRYVPNEGLGRKLCLGWVHWKKPEGLVYCKPPRIRLNRPNRRPSSYNEHSLITTRTWSNRSGFVRLGTGLWKGSVGSAGLELFGMVLLR
jgi:hypothetical protein